MYFNRFITSFLSFFTDIGKVLASLLFVMICMAICALYLQSQPKYEVQLYNDPITFKYEDSTGYNFVILDRKVTVSKENYNTYNKGDVYSVKQLQYIGLAYRLYVFANIYLALMVFIVGWFIILFIVQD